jgi:hypothetical protein
MCVVEAMSVTLKEILDSMSPKQRAQVDRRFKELVNEVESLSFDACLQNRSRRSPRN